MHVVAMIETVPEDNAGTVRQQVDELSADAESYEDAVAMLRERVPAGWRIINLRRT